MPTSTYYLNYDLVHHPIKDTIYMLTGLLEKITKTNDRLQQQTNFGPFHARAIPSIDIESYLLRIVKYCPCANECFLSLLVYFDRMARNRTQLRLDSYNIHRLVICGVMIASKFFSDVFYTNTRYAKVGGLPVKELNLLELEFLRMNDFTLNIQVEELQRYGDQLLMHHRRDQLRQSHLQLTPPQKHLPYVDTSHYTQSSFVLKKPTSTVACHRLPTPPPLDSDPFVPTV
ncbi:cyclin-domain-containing protein [Halteromyces radiatus]|uniref:cyclin-domain-containing protein n=1 Tax=Halteromyces radiatus TaxID=101107 RepID=UPI0022202EDE|nr:cyclin-domain-containing protein [Halteromyces radiatus]KAI8088873.1 cyclin-domain-containing protein [Halteromyces radiatus]